MKEGKITYEMVFSSDNPDLNIDVITMQGSRMVIEFIPGKTRTEVTMGSMDTMITNTDEKYKEALNLMSMSGMKYAMKIDLEKSKKQAEAINSKLEITTEKKVIKGYKCTKAVMTSDDGSVCTIWFTKEIEVNTAGHPYYKYGMPGFPMEISTDGKDEMHLEMKAVAIAKKADQHNFSMVIPDGYTEVSLEGLAK